MNVSYKWLNEYVDLTGVSPEELADKITKAGIEVEQVHHLDKGIKNVVVGYVKECRPHPDSDHLNVTQVDLGDETVQIICGAPNVAAGQKVAVAKVGAVLPGDFKIKKAKLRGETSEGMICSLQELGVDGHLVPKEVADGIYVLDEDAGVGENALPYLNLDDTILELDILANSAYCLNMIGVAYEVASILDRDIRLPEPKVNESAAIASDKISVTVEAADGVPFYGARVVEGVTIAPSPKWLQNKLISVGLRPINNIVDITNYVLMEYGQPLHAFDYDQFGSDRVLVRRAAEGEKMTTLDDAERTLTSEDLVITNGEKPVAIAGVMGGANSEVSSNTKNILLEAALFEGRSIRRTSSRLNLRTDASSRYEKGIDPARLTGAADRAAQMMAEIAGGTILEGIVQVGERATAPHEIIMPWTKINDVLGTDFTKGDILSVFRRLRFEVEMAEDSLTVKVPSRRPDVKIAEDLIEEVGRTIGYDHIPATLPEGATEGKLTDYQKKRRIVERYMTGAGLFQTVTYSLTTKEKTESFSYIEKDVYHPIRLSMPMSEDRSVLRQTLVPLLLEVVQYHLNRRMNDVAVFEIGKVFLSESEKLVDLPTEKERVSGVVTGNWRGDDWHHEALKVDFYAVKGILEGLFNLLGLSDRVSFVRTERKGMHPGRTADVLLDNQLIGYVGQIHPIVQKELDLNDTYVFEVDLTTLLTVDMPALQYAAIPRFPAMTRDIALVVDTDVSAGSVTEVIRSSGGKLLKDIRLFDLYTGERMEEGKKSLAFSLTYLDPERTLTDEEVTKVHSRVLAELETQLGAVLRG
jgi:phenylalanyl-tRNA synthetase beta chain